ncbi:MAG TPA: MalY/PatB family protein [Clostridia bacterium]|nr:MalY/PatB family protein [Clostridia bacterium]
MNLDKIINRNGTNSIKWDRFKDRNALPLWVADMDFKSPEKVIDALVKRAEHGVFGYTSIPDEYYVSIKDWYNERQSWDIDTSDIIYTPGVVTALSAGIQAFTKPGDEVIIQPPVYYPFKKTILNNDRRVLNNELLNSEEGYTIDFDDLTKKAKRKSAKLLILCSPHNPVGRVWRKEELFRIGQICEENNVKVISDEIHGDLIFDGYTQIPYASVNQEMADHSMICTAPSKTFNIAGLDSSNIIISNEEMKEKYLNVLEKNDLVRPNIFGLVGTIAAYDYGDEWLIEVMSYIEQNYNFLKEFIETKLPKVKVNQPEGTFLVWLDFTAYKLSNEGLEEKLIEDAKVILNQGYVFGEGGDGFVRLNLATSKEQIEKALEQIAISFS